MHAGEEVHVSLAVGDALGLLLRVDEHQVACSHTHVDGNAVGIREVYVAHDVQRLLVIGIESEVLEHQVGAYDADGVVVEAHADAVGNADEIG